MWSNCKFVFSQTKQCADIIIPRGADNAGKLSIFDVFCSF